LELVRCAIFWWIGLFLVDELPLQAWNGKIRFKMTSQMIKNLKKFYESSF